MPQTIQCPKCRQSYQVDDHLSGKAVQCNCGARLQIPARVAAAAGRNDLSDWIAQELTDIEVAKRKADELASVAAAEKAEKDRRMTSSPPAQTTTKRRTGRTLKQSVNRAILTSVIVLLLALAGGGAGVWYIHNHPAEGAAAETRASRLGMGLGTTAAIGMSFPWLLVAFRYQKLKKS